MSLEEKKKTESKEKDKALSLVLGQIERNFGRGSIMRLGDASRMKVETKFRNLSHSMLPS